MILVICGLLDCETRSSVSYWPGENPYNRSWVLCCRWDCSRLKN